MARTTRDGPDMQSPAAKTASEFVSIDGSTATIDREFKSIPNSSTIPFFGTPVKPILNKIKSASILKSSPFRSVKERGRPEASKVHSQRASVADFANPPFTSIDLTFTAHSLSQPSRWLLEVRSIYGHIGHGVDECLWAGGSGIISTCTTDFAPWRIAVPTQSEPVSPPPTTSTFLPFAEISRLGDSPEITRFCEPRKSSAKNTPRAPLPADGRTGRAPLPLPPRTSRPGVRDWFFATPTPYDGRARPTRCPRPRGRAR